MGEQTKRAWVQQDELDWVEGGHGERYASRRKQLGAAAGGQRLGCSLYEVEPGKAAWPLHYHLANEEAIYILEGSALLEHGAQRVSLEAGAYVALRVATQEQTHAHRLTNVGQGVLRYLCVSTMREPDVTIYPETGKVGIFAGAAPGGPKEARTYEAYLDDRIRRGYWDGEG